jgi:hypothetical protein
MTEYITQAQATAIAHSVTRAGDYLDTKDLCNAAIQHYRDSLVAGVVLPEPDCVADLDIGPYTKPGGREGGRIYKAVPAWSEPLVRQAIADSQAMQEPDYEQSETYLRTQSELAKQVPPEKCSLCGAPIGEECFLQNSSQSNCKMAKQVPQGYKLVPETPTNDMTVAMANALEDPENERSSWDLAENMYAAMLAAAPDPKEGA